MTELRNLNIAARDSFSIDAFGRWRVSEPFTIFDAKLINDHQPLFFDEIVSGAGASATFDTGESSVSLSVTQNADYVVRQTFMRFNYQPGKSQQIILTGVLGEPVANTSAKIGYFNSSTAAPYTASLDGVYFGSDGTDNFVAISNNGTEDKATQANWNIDAMDGTGPSGITVDFDRVQIFFIDIEWLGVGRVRVGLVIDGLVYYVHEFLHANVSGQTKVYMQSANHSVRYEARSTGGTLTVKQICSTVISEGGLEPSGVVRAISNGTSSINVGTTTEGILFYRLNSSRPETTIALDSFSILNTANNTNNYRYSVLLNPTIAGTALSYTNISNSAVDFAVGQGNNTLTGGVEILTGYISGDSPQIQVPTNIIINAGIGIDGTQDEFALAVQTFSGSDTFVGSFNIRELTCG